MKEFDAEMEAKKEAYENSHPNTHPNKNGHDEGYPKGLILAFKLKKILADGDTEQNGGDKVDNSDNAKKESGKACEEKAPENTDAKEENSDDAEELKVSDAQGSGLLSVLDRALTDEEEYRRARAQVQRKGVEAEGYAVEGISVGGHETCVTVPSLNVAFDNGRGPLFAVRQDHLFITHAHLDHIVLLSASSIALLNTGW